MRVATLLRAATAAAAIAALAGGAPAHADGISCDASLRTESERTAAAGAELEKAGKLVEAYAHYRSAGEYCDVASAKDGMRRVGKALGAAAEKAGREVGADRLPLWESKTRCPGKATPECVTSKDLDALRGASALAWYEGSDNLAESDRMMLARAKARPGDLEAFGRAWSHFQTREAAGPYDPVKPGSPRATLQRQAEGRAALALEAEVREFAKGTDGMGTGSARCIAQLEQAKTWREAALLDLAPVQNRAVERGDARARGTSLIELAEAKRFYEFAGREDRKQAVEKKAAAEGEKAAAAGERLRAAQYFALAGDEERARAMAPQVDAAAVKKPDAEKARKEMLKTDAEKEKFRKEQADLEKELGM